MQLENVGSIFTVLRSSFIRFSYDIVIEPDLPLRNDKKKDNDE